jgi:GNAT superfamily N-acetyltransferase
MRLAVRPLTRDRWDDLVELFNRRGGSIVRGCWCMHYRRSGSGLDLWGKANKRAMKALVDGGTVPGLIGYRDKRPVGWISVGPREDYLRLGRSPVMKRVDHKPVWSIVCFFVDPEERGQGLTRALLQGAIDYARLHGATLLEGYPLDKKGRSPPDSMWFGAKSLYDRAGFKEVARRKATRPIVRRALRLRRPH